MRFRTIPGIVGLGILVVTLSTACTTVENATSKVAPNYETAPDAININTATKTELQRLPFVAEKLADLIIEHRERFGPFRRPEHLLLIKGVSDKRFRQIRHLIRVD